MMKVVIDTNIIISSNLSSKGKPAEIMSLFYTGKLQMFYTDNIFAEYKRVLAYPRLNIAASKQTDIINALEVGGIFIPKPPTSTIHMLDESDREFYDTAKAIGAVLITGNLKHFPVEPFIMNPADFLSRIRRG
jgi:putative PIN family toxin of toxin-antitoxin system